MSLILEALQRAEKDRREEPGSVPGIDTSHADVAPPPREEPVAQQGNRWITVAIAAIIVLLSYLIYLQLNGPAAEAPAAISSTPIATPPVADETMPEKEREPQPTFKPIESDTQPHHSASERLSELPAPAAPPTAESLDALYASAKKEREQDTLDEGIAAARAIHGQDIAPSVDSEPKVQEPDRNDKYSIIPFASQLPLHQQSSIPPVRYTTHGYSKKSGRGMVTLNGRSLRAGDRLESGMTLVDIRGEYIVLDLNGLVFRLPAAEDWAP